MFIVLSSMCDVAWIYIVYKENLHCVNQRGSLLCELATTGHNLERVGWG